MDDETLYTQIKDYVAEIAPKKESIVKMHDSNVPVFEKYGVERQIKTTFGRTVSINKGAYLVIEHTEAMHVIDVNSGGRVKSDNDGSQEANAFQVNLDSAVEVARQLRMRDMVGQREVFARLRELFARDFVRVRVEQFQKFACQVFTGEIVLH